MVLTLGANLIPLPELGCTHPPNPTCFTVPLATYNFLLDFIFYAVMYIEAKSHLCLYP